MTAVVSVWTGGLALVAAMLAVTSPNAVYGLLYLVVSLLGLAATFFALGADFAGALLILVYVGAIVVVFVFIVMTIDPGPAERARRSVDLARAWPASVVVAAMVVAPFLAGFGWSGVGAPMAISAQAVGRLLFGSWASAVELASMLLLAGLIGVRRLGRRTHDRGENS